MENNTAPVAAAEETASSNEAPSEEVQETSQASSAEQPTEEASAQEQAKQAEIKYLKSLKLKVDGKEFEEELPVEIPEDPEVIEYLTRNLQLAKMSQNRAKQYSQLEKEVAEWIEQLRTNPEEALSRPGIGIDLKKLAAGILEKEIENSKKSPEQLEKEKMANELKKLKEEREKEKADWEKKELERLQEIESERLDQQISRALEDAKDLPKSPYVVKKIGNWLLFALQNGYSVSPADVMSVVRDEIHSDVKAMFAAMPEEVVEQFVGKDKIKNIRKKYIEKAKEAPKSISKSIQDVSKASQSKQESDKKQTYKDFFKF